MPDKKGRLTGMEAVFVERYVASGDATYAAEKAGYAHPVQRGHSNLRNPALSRQIKGQMLDRLHTVALPLAVNRAISILEDPKATEATVTKVMAVVFKHTFGAQETDGAEEKEPYELTAEQLARRRAALQAEIKLVDTVAGDRAVDITPEAGVFG